MPANTFLANSMARQEAAQIARRGQATTVSGASPNTQAIWQEAQPGHVATFLDELDWQRGVFIVQFVPGVLGAPWLLKHGSSVVHVRRGWKTVVRHIDEFDPADVNIAVQCICAAVPV